MIGLTIPVVALSDDGEKLCDRVAGRPCIRIGFSWEQLDGPTADDPRIKWTYGMIDTGADIIAVDAAFANPVAALKVPHKTWEAHTVSGPADMQIYKGFLFVANSSRCIPVAMEFGTAPMNHGYKIVLGRSFLDHTTFTYNRTHGIKKIVIG
ncbi:hypothetical protein IVB08_33100 [Bradyrhizobium sp. 173]|uniref:hypothetical protein n=1 Tax=Bradyrhizobium sp. 173 TaxID=2782644 RepID=UPI001FF81BD8|nr:hypothetical protein [Bradyrhizobium sp. 173]MCK1568705.1 hypothetical protein [Bradyrhizobium sp. 173]